MRYISLSWILDYLTVSSIPTASSTSARYHHKNILFIVTICYDIKADQYSLYAAGVAIFVLLKARTSSLSWGPFLGMLYTLTLNRTLWLTCDTSYWKRSWKQHKNGFALTSLVQIIEIFSKKFIRKYNYGWEK